MAPPVPENGSVRLSVTIRADQKAFLDLHQEYSASGILQKAIDELMEAKP